MANFSTLSVTGSRVWAFQVGNGTITFGESTGRHFEGGPKIAFPQDVHPFCPSPQWLHTAPEVRSKLCCLTPEALGLLPFPRLRLTALGPLGYADSSRGVFACIPVWDGPGHSPNLVLILLFLLLKRHLYLSSESEDTYKHTTQQFDSQVLGVSPAHIYQQTCKSNTNIQYRMDKLYYHVFIQ